MDPAVLCQAGYVPDPLDPRGAYRLVSGGQRQRVFIKRARSHNRRAAELAALELIQAHAPGLPVPRVLDSFEAAGEPYLAFAYQEGVNLADLLELGPQARPLPPWYKAFPLSEKPPVRDLLPLLREVGRAVRGLHAVPVELFGRLPGAGDNPNPYRTNARAFTAQEINHQTFQGQEKATLSSSLSEAVRRWSGRAVECLGEDEPACLIHFDLHAGNVRARLAGGQWRLGSLYDFEIARGWLAEWDLAVISEDLSWLANETPPGAAWLAFLDGYGPVDAERLRLFQVVRLLTTIAYADRYPDWGRWALERLSEFL